jgi:hypothetical protein
MPYKEEDEGYLAAETGRRLSENPHPRGTIRYDDWRRGWYAKSHEVRRKENEGYPAAETGHSLSENPHQPGTIRYKQWRRDWYIKNDEVRRAVRLGKT